MVFNPASGQHPDQRDLGLSRHRLLLVLQPVPRAHLDNAHRIRHQFFACLFRKLQQFRSLAHLVAGAEIETSTRPAAGA